MDILMKTRLLTALCLVGALLLLTLTGCSNTPGESDAGSSAPAQTTPAETKPETTAPPATEPDPNPTQSADPTEPDNPTEPADPTEPTQPTEPTTPPAGGKGAAVAAKAQSLIGKPFKMGATGPDEFDNSGFIYYCYMQNGVTLPRRTGDMFKAGTAVEKADLQPGDVVFFYMDTEGAAQFAGIYMGNQKFISCNNEESPVKEQDMSWPYYAERFLGARRYA